MISSCRSVVDVLLRGELGIEGAHGAEARRPGRARPGLCDGVGSPKVLFLHGKNEHIIPYVYHIYTIYIYIYHIPYTIYIYTIPKKMYCIWRKRRFIWVTGFHHWILLHFFGATGAKADVVWS